MSQSKAFYKDITSQTRDVRRRIGHNLHIARVDRGITLEKLARSSGLSLRCLDLIEMGKGDINLRYIVALAIILRVDVSVLLTL